MIEENWKMISDHSYSFWYVFAMNFFVFCFDLKNEKNSEKKDKILNSKSKIISKYWNLIEEDWEMISDHSYSFWYVFAMNFFVFCFDLKNEKNSEKKDKNLKFKIKNHF